MAAQGEGAGIAVDQAALMVRYAENTRKVLTAAQAAGGVTVLVQTGVTLATQQGLAACAKFAAKRAAGYVASGVAAAAGNYALDKLDIDPQTRQWMQLGLDLFQVFAFVKAKRSTAAPGSQCFVAGTRVLTGIDADGSYRYKNVEDIGEDDWVLSRNQFDVDDDVMPHRIKQTFRRTAYALRVLVVRDIWGTVRTLRTTDSHPFYVDDSGWTKASDLKIGTKLNDAEGTNSTVVIALDTEEYPEGVTVFNFEVEGDHTYFVTDASTSRTSGIWVHNANYSVTARVPTDKLQKNWDKHKADWGLSGGWSKANGEAWKVAIEAHVRRQDLTIIIGKYRSKPGFVHYLDKQTGRNVVLSKDGYFVAGFKLFSSQLESLLFRGDFF